MTYAMKPGAAGTPDPRRRPGDYVLICNGKGRYAAGMMTPFTVTRN